MSLSIPLLLAVNLVSNSIGTYWIGGLNPRSTGIYDTIGSDGWVREDNYIPTYTNASAYYAVMDKFDILQNVLYGSTKPVTNKVINLSNFYHYDNFLAMTKAGGYWEWGEWNLRGVPYAMEKFGGRSFDIAFSQLGYSPFSTFSWVDTNAIVRTCKGWWPSINELASDGYFSSPNFPSVYSEVFGALEYGELYEYLHMGESCYNQIIDDTVEDFYKKAFVRFDEDSLDSTNKILSLKAVDNAAKVLGVFDTYFDFYGTSHFNCSVTHTNTTVYFSASGETEEGERTAVFPLIVVDGTSYSSLTVTLVDNPSISFDEYSCSSNIQDTVLHGNFRAPRMRITKPHGGGSVSGSIVIGHITKGYNSISNSLLQVMADGETASLMQTFSADGCTTSGASGGNVYDDMVGSEIYYSGIVDVPMSYNYHISYSVDVVNGFDYENTLKHVIFGGRLSDYFTYYSYDEEGEKELYDIVGSMIYYKTTKTLDALDLPSIDDNIEYNEDKADDTKVWYCGMQRKSLSFGEAVQEFTDRYLFRDGINLCFLLSYGAAYESEEYRDPMAFCGIGKYQIEEFLGRATRALTLNQEVEGSVYTNYCTVRKGTNGLSIVSGELVQSMSFDISASVNGTAEDLVSKNLPAVGVDTKQVAVLHQKLRFPVLQDASSGSLGTVLKYRTDVQSDNRSTNSYSGCDGIQEIDGDDPVRHVNPYSFYKAFYSMPKLRKVNMNECTNVMEHGFCEAFAGCPCLKEVSFKKLQDAGDHSFSKCCYASFSDTNGYAKVYFSSLGYAGYQSFYRAFMPWIEHLPNYGEAEPTNCTYMPEQPTVLNVADFSSISNCARDAFMDAFAGCTNLVDVQFPKLATCGSNAFHNAFRNTSITNINFSSLNTIPLDCFSNAFVNCANVKDVYFNCLSNTYDIPIIYSTNTINVYLSNAGTNAILNLTNCAVDTIYFTNCEKVVNFNELMIPTNEDWRVCVSTNIFAEWVASDGWDDYEDHITCPYKVSAMEYLDLYDRYDFFVSQMGSDDNSGTNPHAPKRTLEGVFAAAAKMGTNDFTCCVMPGSLRCTNSVYWTKYNSSSVGAALNRITFESLRGKEITLLCAPHNNSELHEEDLKCVNLSPSLSAGNPGGDYDFRWFYSTTTYGIYRRQTYKNLGIRNFSDCRKSGTSAYRGAALGCGDFYNCDFSGNIFWDSGYGSIIGCRFYDCKFHDNQFNDYYEDYSSMLMICCVAENTSFIDNPIIDRSVYSSRGVRMISGNGTNYCSFVGHYKNCYFNFDTWNGKSYFMYGSAGGSSYGYYSIPYINCTFVLGSPTTVNAWIDACSQFSSNCYFCVSDMNAKSPQGIDNVYGHSWTNTYLDAQGYPLPGCPAVRTDGRGDAGWKQHTW